LQETSRLLTATVIAVSLLGACASTRAQEGAGEYVDDKFITTKVEAAILGEPTLKSAEINVETFKGRVQLSGCVPSHPQMSTAVMIARNVQGVIGVANDLQMM